MPRCGPDELQARFDESKAGGSDGGGSPVQEGDKRGCIGQVCICFGLHVTRRIWSQLTRFSRRLSSSGGITRLASAKQQHEQYPEACASKLRPGHLVCIGQCDLNLEAMDCANQLLSPALASQSEWQASPLLNNSNRWRSRSLGKGRLPQLHHRPPVA